MKNKALFLFHVTWQENATIINLIHSSLSLLDNHYTYTVATTYLSIDIFFE